MQSILTGALQEDSTLTGRLPDEPTLTGRLPGEPTLTGRLPDEPTLTGRLQDAPTLTGRLQDTPTLTGPLPEERRSPEETAPTVLTDEIKEFIVRGLARYEGPLQVAAGVKARFGIEISRQLVHTYNPSGSRPVAERWCELHAVTRAKFLADVSEIGVAQKVVRLRMLDHFARLAMENHYTIKAAAFLEQAAKECGGIYENRRPRAAATSEAPD